MATKTDHISRASIKDRLIACNGSWQKISKSSRVSHSWISKFCRDAIKNPGVETLRKIERVLDKQGA